MRAYFLFAVFYSFILSSTSQVNFNDFKPIKCEGSIPDDFLASFKLDALENLDRLENENRAVFEARKRFILSNYEIIGETLKSGSVLFGDPISIYLNELLDRILIDRPSLRKKMRIYPMKSGYTNAYCTHQGIIFVTMGMLSKVKTEAELAFIIMHEISHYTEDHLVERIVSRVNLRKKAGGYRFAYYSDLVEKQLQRTKNHELECDSIAAEYLLNSDFNNSVGNSVMNILLRTHLPFEESKFDISIFNDENFTLPEFYEREQLDEINLNEERFDKYSSHPNVRTRKEALNRIIGNTTSFKDKDFLVSKGKFEEIKEIAKFETVNAHLYQREFGSAIYSSAVLLKKHPKNKFLEDAIAYSLYGLSKYATMNDLHKAAKSVREIQGESQQVHHLFRQLSKPQINALAIHYINSVRKDQPDNQVLREMLKNLILDMPKIGTSIEKIRKSKKIKFDSDIDDYKTITDKREKIKANRSLQKKYKNFYLYGLKNDFEDGLLQDFYNDAIEEKEYVDKLDEMTGNQLHKYNRKRFLKATKEGLNIKDKNICFIEPKINFEWKRFDSKKKYLDNIEKKKEFLELYNSHINSLNSLSNKQILTASDLSKNGTKDFNHVTNLIKWESEKISHSTDDIIPLTTHHVAESHKNIDYVCGVHFENLIGAASVYTFYIVNLKSGETKFQYTLNGGKLSVKQLMKLVKMNLNTLSK